MLKYSRIILAVIWTIGLVANLPAQENNQSLARYHFKRVIDRDFPDDSGNGYDGALMMNENSAYVKTDEGEAVQFGKVGDCISLPLALTPSENGRISIRLNFESFDSRQYLWQYYNRQGDGMQLIIFRKKISLQYYHRSTRKWHTADALVPDLQTKIWYNIDISWNLSEVMQIFIDGKLSGEKKLSFKPFFPRQDGEILIGNDRGGKYPFKGFMRLFEFSNKSLVQSITQGKEVEFNKNEIEILENKHLKIVFSKKDLVPVGAIDKASAEKLLSDSYFPNELRLWSFILKGEGGKGSSVLIDNQMAAQKSIKLKDTINGQQIVLEWTNIKASALSDNLAVTVTVSLPNDSPLSYWEIQIKREKDSWHLWKVDFPILNFAQPERNPGAAKLAIPYFWGQLTSDPFGSEKPKEISVKEYVYPANMPMQFFGLYGEKTGIYAATHDSHAYTKIFSLTTDSKRKRIRLGISGMPSNDEQVSAEYKQPYAFVLGSFSGDWYDACQIYRDWALKQTWCQAGPLYARKDIPDYLKETQLLLRMWGAADDNTDTVNLVRSLRNRGKGSNAAGVKQYLKSFDKPIIAIWYDWIAAKYNDNTAIPKHAWKGPTDGAGNGRFVEPWSDVQDTLGTLTPQGAKLLAYMNSVMYDQGSSPIDNDAKLLKNSTILNENGNEITYNKTSIPCWRMNAGSKAWQNRFSLLAERAVKLGFSGVYMDSFGRAGIPIGFHPETGKSIGRGNDLFNDQRILGSMVRTTIKKINPEAILSAEAASEGFIDIVDLNLIHYNVFTDSCPLFFAVYHDYQINYGRTFARTYWGGEEWELRNYKLNLSSLFVNGAVLGRFFQGFPGKPFPFADNEKEYLAFLEQLVKMRKQYNSFIHLGKMMRPLDLSPEPRNLSEGTPKRPYTVHEIMSSSWRSTDGKIIFVLINVTDQAKNIKVRFLPEKYGLEKGEKISVKQVTVNESKVLPWAENDNSNIHMKLIPWQVVVLEFGK